MKGRLYCTWTLLPLVMMMLIRCIRSFSPGRLIVRGSHLAFLSHDPISWTETIAPGPAHQSELEIKKSRFIGYAQHVDSWSEAQSHLEAIRKEHPKARHWCFAFCGGSHPIQERSSDDGEPTGTAGAPILQAIRSEGLSDTLCMVVRYFGGIRLGAGGLIRAYGSAARQVLRAAPRSQSVPQSFVRVQVDTIHIGTLHDIVSKMQGRCEDEEYNLDDGGLTVTIACATSEKDALRRMLLDATRGSIRFLEHPSAGS